jgi:hypothetical protein
LRKTLLTLALTAAFAGGFAAPASAAPEVPTTSCEIQEFIGVENVKECEDPAS